MSTEIFAKSIEDLFFVYTQLDFAGILNSRFPNKDTFYENKPGNINYSFLKFLDNNPELDDSVKTTLKANFEKGQYTSIYGLFHDIKLACISQILQFEDNPNLYSKIDKFYKISIEILLREAIRLGASLKNNEQILSEEIKNNKEQDEQEKIKAQISQLKPIESAADISQLLEKDFEIITSTFYNNTGKALSIFASGNIPFFSSLNQYKSELDDREPIIDPALGITITDVIPSVSLQSVDNMSKFSDSNIKIPNIRQILENYMHPNWLRLISSQWLKHGSGLSSLNFSFAPSYDETQSIISNDWKGLTWCQQIGFKKLVETKQQYDDLLAKKNASIPIEAGSDTKLKPTDEQRAEKVDIKAEPSNDTEDKVNLDAETNGPRNDESEDDQSQLVDLKNILQFDNNKLVAEDEVKIVELNKVQSTISDLLTDLNQLRQDRIENQKKHARYNKNILGTGSRIFKPSNDEIKLYNKIRRLVVGLIEARNIKPDDLNIEVDKRIPVLQHTYQGTLPASFGATNQKTTKSKRRR
jgi:hypothetical protein